MHTHTHTRGPSTLHTQRTHILISHVRIRCDFLAYFVSSVSPFRLSFGAQYISRWLLIHIFTKRIEHSKPKNHATFGELDKKKKKTKTEEWNWKKGLVGAMRWLVIHFATWTWDMGTMWRWRRRWWRTANVRVYNVHMPRFVNTAFEKDNHNSSPSLLVISMYISLFGWSVWLAYVMRRQYISHRFSVRAFFFSFFSSLYGR